MIHKSSRLIHEVRDICSHEKTVLMQFECCLCSEIRFKKNNQVPNLWIFLLLCTVLNNPILFWTTCGFSIIGPRQELDGEKKAARIIPMLVKILLKGVLPTSHPVVLVRGSSLVKVSSCLLFIAVLNITIEGHLKLFSASAEILECGQNIPFLWARRSQTKEKKK